MATIARTAKAGGGTNFNSGQTIDPAEVNTDFNTAFTEINGNLDDANIETATIPGAKSLRFTEISAPASPSANDVVMYLVNNDTVSWKQSGGFSLSTAIGDASVSETGPPVRMQFSTTSETSCTNSATDLVTATVNIPDGDGFIITGLVRKTSGAAATASLGLKVNSVAIISNFAVTSATDRAEFGTFAYGISSSEFGQGRDTNYTQGATFEARTGPSGGPVVEYPGATYAAQLPTAAITSITITGVTGSALVTVAVKDVTAYRVKRA